MVHAALMAAGQTVQHLLHVTSRRFDHRHAHEIARLRADVQEMLITKITAAVLTSIHESGKHVLVMFSDQAKSYVGLQHKYADALIASTDAMRRAELRALLNSVDENLAALRGDAIAFHAAMSAVLLEAAKTLPGSQEMPLTLPATLCEEPGDEGGDEAP